MPEQLERYRCENRTCKSYGQIVEPVSQWRYGLWDHQVETGLCGPVQRVDGPIRIQLRRTKGWRKPEGAIAVARPSKWGNPFKVGEPHPFGGDGPTTAEQAVVLYRWGTEMCDGAPDFDLSELRGHDLACWCPLVDDEGQPVPCHADVLLELANQ